MWVYVLRNLLKSTDYLPKPQNTQSLERQCKSYSALNWNNAAPHCMLTYFGSCEIFSFPSLPSSAPLLSVSCYSGVHNLPVAVYLKDNQRSWFMFAQNQCWAWNNASIMCSWEKALINTVFIRKILRKHCWQILQFCIFSLDIKWNLGGPKIYLEEHQCKHLAVEKCHTLQLLHYTICLTLCDVLSLGYWSSHAENVL